MYIPSTSFSKLLVTSVSSLSPSKWLIVADFAKSDATLAQRTFLFGSSQARTSEETVSLETSGLMWPVLSVGVQVLSNRWPQQHVPRDMNVQKSSRPFAEYSSAEM